MLGVKFNSKMLWAWFFLALLLIGMVLLRLIRPDESVAMRLVLFITCTGLARLYAQGPVE